MRPAIGRKVDHGVYALKRRCDGRRVLHRASEVQCVWHAVYAGTGKRRDLIPFLKCRLNRRANRTALPCHKYTPICHIVLSS